MDKKLVLVDGSSYLYRAFYALPPLTSPKGEPTGAIYGFIRMISTLIKELNPEYMAVVFDLPGKTFRHEKYKEYKATRKETPDELKVQIPKIKEIIKLWGIKILEIPGYEADDIIATIAKKAVDKGFEVIIVTPDKDMMQLIDEKVFILNPVTGEIFNREKVKEKYGIYPEQFVDYLSMIGDTVDNIIGVRGVGPKTAEKLLNQYGNLKNILEHKDQLKPKLKEAFEEAEERLKENIFLVSLEKNIDIDIQPEDLKKEKADLLKLRDIFKELGFKSLLKDIEKKKVIEKKVEQRTLF
ncbi:MAG TPA: 5'-3' exonuclease [Persephonella sp.]|uniref:DNA polymerase I n=1 Tax=Persephonella marina (strain DSM 14350 / EX-H1) TaxID=123214 RepID=C0QU83_PERMH|nr:MULTISPECIES: 5'-3' exonuclease H3TH domain-containing protein [Persephonella]ACO03074.1 DNA polymerase I [Persephonella marina EX-H1]HCB70137.1 5'-3' exonuclease [Persephonella sp.]